MKVEELREFIVLDTETTGFKPHEGADAIEVSALKVVKDEEGRFKVTETFDTYINPGYPLPPAIVEFNNKNNTGVNDTFLSDKPSPEEAAKAVFEFVGDNPVIVGHNINFDIGFIDKLYQINLGIPFNPTERIDTLAICRQKIYAKSHKLGDMYELTQKRNSGENPVFHNSLADCLATLDVLEYLADSFFPQYREIKGQTERPSSEIAEEAPQKTVVKEESFETFVSHITDEKKLRDELETVILNPITSHIRDIPFHMLKSDLEGFAVGIDETGKFVKNSLKVMLHDEANELGDFAFRKMNDTKSSSSPIRMFAVAYREKETPTNVEVCGYAMKKNTPQLIKSVPLDLSDKNIMGNDALCDYDSTMSKLFNDLQIISKADKSIDR